MAENKRIAYFDLLRGLAIIGVIAIHSANTGLKFNDQSPYFIGTSIWRQLINFAVPLFLAISGYFVANKVTDKKSDHISFLRKQIPRVLIPYIAWSLIYMLPLLIRGNYKDVFYRFMTFRTSAPFYYIILIIQYYILLPYLKQLATIKGLLLSAIISGLSCVVIMVCRYYLQVDLPLFIYAGAFTTWIVFFVLGIYIRKNGVPFKPNNLVVFMVIGFLLSLGETALLYRRFGNISDSVTAVKISSFIYSAAIILFAFRFSTIEIKNSKLLVFIGRVSFGIYLSHYLILTILERIFGKILPKLADLGFAYQIVLVMVTLVASCVFAFITRKINTKLAFKYLGQ